MPVYLHTANLILHKRAVEDRYSGGLEQFRKDFDLSVDSYNQEDDLLFCICRMNLDEFDIQALVSKGLQYDYLSGSSEDFTLYGRLYGFTWQVAWLEDNTVFAWHKDDRPELIKRAKYVGEEMTMDVIVKLQEEGVNPLDVIK
ncbi:hypothetical protein OAE48_01600 [Flavobacteriales bacterium]|nr:hypothetical protein [Flavobacteriales bacterium]